MDRARFRQWVEPPRRLLLALLAITLGSASALSWLGWRMLEQDRAVEAQRQQERLEHAAERGVAALERVLAEVEQNLVERLSRPSGQVGQASRPVQDFFRSLLEDDGLILIFRPQMIEAFPASRLLYYPSLPQPPEPPAAIFASGEAMEFRENNLQGAAEVFRRLAGSAESSPGAGAIRAGALLRLGRVLRKAQQAEAALEVYAQMAALGETRVGGAPAELLGRHARCAVLEGLHRTTALRQQAEALDRDL